jgi:formate hydrogenlyase subunit 4
MKKAYLAFLAVLANIMLYAQEKSTDVVTTTTTNSSSNWYASPWVWVLGAAVFIILLVALTSGSRRSTSSGDKVTVTKTVRRDTDV